MYNQLQFLKAEAQNRYSISRSRSPDMRPTFCSLETRSRHGKKKLTARSKTGAGSEGKV
ncbi:hypothetical protein D8674_011286 [Pyrus ussuriensis x Pyrus communis]|uniref:Uncharacterized protein n=1 Tax=Pyrus ussuriensis x Pyrus communis TaxID=2448454 RepID=A0A5N5FYB1_9ROSA|nr:hypothetical protein D8674_011286 [Pyrus ussuriensis x Pyrus communis]